MKQVVKFASWKVEKLGDLCDVITKGTTPTTLGFSFVDSGVNFVKIESLDEDGNFLPNKMAHVTTECHNSFKRSQLQENDILFSIAGALGRVGLVNKDILPANTNQALAIIRLSNLNYTLPSFVIHCLKSQTVFDQINKFKAGVAQLNLSLEQIRELQIPVPHLPEQQRIVSLLDETFAGLAKVHENAERNLVNAREVFEAVQDEIFENGEDWEKKLLGDVCKVTGELTRDIDSSLPYIGADSIESNSGRLIKKKTVLEQGIRGPIFLFSGKKLLYSKIRPYLNKLSITNFKGYCSSDMYPLEFNKSVLYEFAQHYLLSKRFMKSISGFYQRAAIPKINRNDLFSVSIPLPPLAEQRAIVARLDGLAGETRRLEEVYQSKVEGVDELRRSVLREAFEGGL
jgi:restriction endonuclease S subunit